MTRTDLVIRYSAFAAFAAGCNLLAQRIVLGAIDGPMALTLAMGVGTGAGLVVKYLLDKRWIFADFSRGARAHARRFGVYTLILLTTFLLFYLLVGVRERQLYQMMKPELLASSKDHGLSVQTLLARIADDDDLDDIREQLMDDVSIQPTSRAR